MKKNALTVWISGILATTLWVAFYVSEYNGGVYADTHQTTGNIF